MNQLCRIVISLSLILFNFPDTALADDPSSKTPPEDIPILNNGTDDVESHGNGEPPVTESSSAEANPADAMIEDLAKTTMARAFQFKPLEEMALGRAIKNANPKQYEDAVEDLMQSGLVVGLEDILNLRTTDRLSVLDLMIQVESEQAYFAGTAIYLLTDMAFYDIKKPLPISVSALLGRAKNAKNEIAIRYLSGFQKALKKAKSDAYDREEYTLSVHERAQRKANNSLSRTLLLIAAGLFGYVLLEYPMVFVEFSDFPRFLSFLEKSEGIIMGPGIKVFVSASALAAAVGAVHCLNSFRTKRQFRRLRRGLQNHKRSSMEGL